MKSSLLLVGISSAVLSGCYMENTLTSNIGGRTLSFSKDTYPLDSLTATVERRRTRRLYLYDSIVIDNKSNQVLYHRQLTEDKDEIIEDVITQNKTPL